MGRLGRAGLPPGGYVDSAVEPEEEEDDEDEEEEEENEEQEEEEDDEEEDEDEDGDDEEKAFQLRVFNLFMKRTVAEVKAATPGITPSEIFDECALRWGIAPENPINDSGGGGAGAADGARVAATPCTGTQSGEAAAGVAAVGPAAARADADGFNVRGSTASGEADGACSPHVVGVTWTVGVTWNARAGKW